MGIKIPAVTLSVRAEAGEEAGELNGNAVGLGLLVLCLLAVFYGNTAQLASDAYRVLCIAFGATFAIAVLLGAAFDKRFHGVFRRYRPVVVASTVCCVTSVALLGVGYVPGVVQVVLAALCGMVLGCVTSLLVFYWGISFGRADAPNIAFNASISTAIAVLLYALVIEKLPFPAAHLVVCVVPLLNIFFLRERVTENLPNPDMREATYFSELNIARGSFAVKIFPALTCLGFVLALLLSHAGYCLTPAAGGAGAGLTALAMVLSCVIVLISTVQTARHDQSFNHTFRLMMPIVALFILPLPFTGTNEVSLGALLILTAMAMCITLSWTFLSNVCQEFRLSPVYVFGLGSGAIACGMLAAGAVATLAPPFVDGIMSQSTFGLVLCLVGLVVVCGLFPRKDDIHAIVVRSFAPGELYGAEDEGTVGEEAPTVGANASAVSGRDSARSPVSATSDAPAEGEQARKGRFMRRCDQVADTYLLSRRETDVLYLLAKGRNVGYIKEKLYISEGTAKTHVHHVYKKLNVHSQQELIALIESIEA